MSDRTVHAAYEGMEIVRYDRTGKWYLEPTSPDLKRQHVDVGDAARSAVWALEHDGWVEFRLPGGATFDRAVSRVVGRETP